MTDVVALFKDQIEDLFGADAVFTAIPRDRIRVDVPNDDSKVGLKMSQSIVLSFDSYVIKAYMKAIEENQEGRLQKYVKSLRRLIQRKLIDYNPDGDRGSAFLIYIDSEATDL